MPRKAFLLRIDPEVLTAVQRWADEDLRSLNGQIEFLLRQALSRRSGKRPQQQGQDEGEQGDHERHHRAAGEQPGRPLRDRVPSQPVHPVLPDVHRHLVERGGRGST